MIYGDGSVYQGRFINNLPEGLGYLEYVNKDKYKGQFKQGRKDGKGTYCFSEGTVFEGMFHNNLKV